MGFRSRLLEDRLQVPADGLAFAVRVGGQDDRPRLLRRLLELGDDLAALGDDDVLGLEIVLDVDAELALRQVPDVAHGGHDLVVRTPDIG